MTEEERQARNIFAAELQMAARSIDNGASPRERTEIRQRLQAAEKRLADVELRLAPGYNPQHGGGQDWMTDERIGRRERLSI